MWNRGRSAIITDVLATVFSFSLPVLLLLLTMVIVVGRPTWSFSRRKRKRSHCHGDRYYRDGGDRPAMFPVTRTRFHFGIKILPRAGYCEKSCGLCGGIPWESWRLQQTLWWSCSGGLATGPTFPPPNPAPLLIVVPHEEHDEWWVGDTCDMNFFKSFATEGPTVPRSRSREMVDLV